MSFIGDLFGGKQAYGEVKQNDVGINQGLLGQQQQFADMLRQQAQGQGPSVANQQLQQALQQQQAASAAQAAGARGINPGLAMRQAMQQQGQASQAAAQSGALARAQEALGAEGMLGQQLGGMQNQYLQAQTANQAANLQAQALTRQAGQAGAKTSMDVLGGLGQGIMGAGKALGFAEGGEVKEDPKKHLFSNLLGGSLAGIGGKYPEVTQKDQSQVGQAAPSQWEQIGKGLLNRYVLPKLSSPTGVTPMSQVGKAAPPIVTPQMAHGGKIPAMLSPGEIYVPPSKTQNSEQAAQYAAHAAATGKKIPGKAKVKGDSLKNDVVPAELEEGGIVVKRTKAKDPDDAAEFVRTILASQKRRKD